MAARRDITIIRGDDYAHVITIQLADGTAINIAGRTYTAELKVASSQTIPDATFTCVVTDGAGGEVTIYLADAITSDLASGCYKWSFKQDASGVKTTILKGKADVVTAPTS